MAQFDPNTNTIRYKEDVIEYFMAHESFHAEEMYKIGFDEYVKNAHIEDTPWAIENKITQYKREKYVYERLVEENGKTYKFNADEVGVPPPYGRPPFGHAFEYYDTIKYELEMLLKDNGLPFPN